MSDTEVYQVLAALFFNRYFLQEETPYEEPCLVVFQDTPEATVLVDRPSIAEFISEYLRTTRNLWRLSRVMTLASKWTPDATNFKIKRPSFKLK